MLPQRRMLIHLQLFKKNLRKLKVAKISSIEACGVYHFVQIKEGSRDRISHEDDMDELDQSKHSKY